MSTPHPTTPPDGPRRGPDLRAWRPERRALWWVLAAFALGLVAFAFMVRDHDGSDFFRADTLPPVAADRTYAPLPAPLPAGAGSGLDRVDGPAAPSRDVVIEAEPVPPPPPVPAAPPASEPVRPAEAVTRDARPIPGQTPSPDYPVRALRRGEGGTALVIVHIGPDGVPTATELAQSTGSRDLDRAAQQAVRRWRFEPATENGRPIVGRAVVPIDFRPGG